MKECLYKHIDDNRKKIEISLKETEEKLKEALEIAGLATWELDILSSQIKLSGEVKHLFGLSPGEFASNINEYLKRIHPGDRDYLKWMLEKTIFEKKSTNFDYRLTFPDQIEHYITSTCHVELDHEGKAIRLKGIIHDVTDQKLIEKELKLISAVFEKIVEGIVITDEKATILNVNPSFTSITGYSKEEAIGQNPRILKSERHSREFYKKMWDSIIKKGKWKGEIWNRRKNGETYPEWLEIVAIYDHYGKITNFISVFSDLTDDKFKDAQIALQLYHDPLTGLPNRLYFNEILKQEINQIENKSALIGILFLDIDRFKNINNTLGHYLGDQLLQSVAVRLASVVSEKDTIARIGGDEFNIMLPNIKKPEETAYMAEKINTAFKDPFLVENQEVFVTISIGISLYPSDGEDSDTLLKTSDMAMFKAKESGRNRYYFFTEELNQRVSKRLSTENSLRRAIDKSQFILYYQPQMEISTEKITGFEALIRWNHGESGIIAPDNFIPIAEETDMIQSIGEWVFRKACLDYKQYIEPFYNGIRISVNLSPRQFHQKKLIDIITNILLETKMNKDDFGIEITENAIMGNVENAVRILSSFKDNGIKVYIDDFGTGYSSLSYLKAFPIDTLKVDKSFIIDLPNNAKDSAITKSVIELAHNLNLEVVAEGVETIETLDILKHYNCDYIQGYLISKPIPIEKAIKFIKN